MQLFAYERKQIALMADEIMIDLLFIAINRLEMRFFFNEDNTGFNVYLQWRKIFKGTD